MSGGGGRRVDKDKRNGERTNVKGIHVGKKEYSEVKRNKRTERGMREGKRGIHKGGKVKLYIICNVGYFPSIKFS